MTFNFNHLPEAGWIKNTRTHVLIVESDHEERGAVNKDSFFRLLDGEISSCPLKRRNGTSRWPIIGYFKKLGPDLVSLEVSSSDFQGGYLLLTRSLKRLQAGEIQNSPIRRIDTKNQRS